MPFFLYNDSQEGKIIEKRLANCNCDKVQVHSVTKTREVNLEMNDFGTRKWREQNNNYAKENLQNQKAITQNLTKQFACWRA